MDETILLPSPNWFLVSTFAVSADGWLIYGGPSKSLCVLEPRKADVGIIAGNDKYQAHVVIRAHHEKIVSVDISPEWLEKKTFLTGSSDGGVKHWALETVNNKIKIKATHSHDVHQQEKEDVVGVGYSDETTAITVGCYGNIVKWDLSSNITKTFPYFMKNFKPTCMACSLHTSLHVAVGTKQGVIFLMDLNGNGKILYKVRGQDDEVMNVSWCPQYEVIVKKTVKESENRSFLAKRLAAIRSEGEKESALEQSGIGKNLPEDSFDESIVQEDDMFDIYKDHESDEFGHKKYEPEDILVKVKKEKSDDTDYLAECLKLKEEILRRRNQTEPTIESLVDALDKTHVEGATDALAESSDVENAEIATESAETATECVETATECSETAIESAETSTSIGKCDKTGAKVSCESSHLHKHLLASVGKYGGVRIWSKSGKLVGSCAIPNNVKNIGKKVIPFSPTVLWYKANSLLIVDGKSQLLECNPLNIDCKNKLAWQIVHALHKRGMYCIATNAPRVQTESMVPSDDWSVWSAAQDRNIIRYCLRTKKVLGVHATCGGFVYTVQACPYDAGKVAISVGDGAVRVWECATLASDDTRLAPARVTSYWQNVQGKVLTVAWHPTREHLLAFATGEARVGLIDTSSRTEKPARVLLPALTNGVYSLCWGEGMQLYASGGGSLVMYHANQTDEAPEPVDITLEGQKWSICAVTYTPRGLLCGSFAGAVALLTHRPPHTPIAAAFLFSKMIHAMEWHPQQTSSSSEESPYKNLIAVTSLDRESKIVILEYGTNEDGTRKLSTWKTLSGHRLAVLHIAWNPHRDGLLLSSSQESTVRVWDISTGSCISIFGGHSQSSLGVSWVAQPQLPHHVMSGGGDACLRLWDIYEHKAENYDETRHEVATKRSSKKSSDKKAKPKEEPETDASISVEDLEKLATNLDNTNTKLAKAPKRFLLPLMSKQMNDPCKLQAPKKMLQMYLEKTEVNGDRGDGIQNIANEQSSNIDEKGDVSTTKVQSDIITPVDETGDGVENTVEENKVDTESGDENEEVTDDNNKGDSNNGVQEIDLDFLKIFGTIREVNEYLDLEMATHLEAGHLEAWIMLSIFRGHIDTMIQFASQRNMLCPFLLSMAPCVSFKYWKDATQLYLAQIDRLVARSDEEKLYENRMYGGPKYRKAAILLSMHDVMGAVNALTEGKLYKEAYILCRIRYMDSVAEQVLKSWAEDLAFSGHLTMSAVCYIAMDNLSQAAQVLARSHNQECLSLAADLAKFVGRTTFADHVEKKAQTKSQATEKTEELLKELPSKIELLMKEDKPLNGDSLKSDTVNGDTKTNE